MSDIERTLLFNGVNASTGNYLFQPLSVEAIAQAARGEQIDQMHYRHLQNMERGRTTGHLGVSEHVDPDALEQAGWGIIVPSTFDPQILEALRPLLDHRRSEAAAIRPGRYKEFTDHHAYRSDESANQWLARQGVAPGPVTPDRGVPYYLLIVGSPEEIPYRFQYHLDVQHAVGRIYFSTLAEYRRYAESVVLAETGKLTRPQRVALAGVVNGDDRSTKLSAEHLITPLAESLRTDARFDSWAIDQVAPSATTKAGMTELIGGPQTPPILFTTSHGIGFDPEDPRLLRHQGALLCQDWPGWNGWGAQPISEDFYFSADDLHPGSRVWSSIFFHFACYSAGTPREDDFSHQALLRERTVIAPHAFVSGLAQSLLSHENGGALAVIGHVDRAWTWSFRWKRIDSNVTVFADALKRLMRGQRVGFAMEKFNERYGQIATNLVAELEDIKFGKKYDPLDLADLWTANNDARAYIIVGDPAVRLVFAPDAAVEPPQCLLDHVGVVAEPTPSTHGRAPSAENPSGEAQAAVIEPPTSATPPEPASIESPPASATEPPTSVPPSSPSDAGVYQVAGDFGLFTHEYGKVLDGGQHIATTMLFVHGTGTRAQGYAEQIDAINRGLARHLPNAAIHLAKCFWGEEHGVDLTQISAVLPPERAAAFDAEGDEEEQAASLWTALYRDPLCELRTLALGTRPDAGLDLATSFAERLSAALVAPTVQRFLIEADAVQVSESAVTAVTNTPTYRQALGAANQPRETYAAVLARAIVAMVIVRAEQVDTSSVLASDAELRESLVAAVATEIEPEVAFGPGGAIKGALAWPFLQVATSWANWDRTKSTQTITPYPGDVLRYLCRGDAIRNAILQRLIDTQAPVILAHSLGGIACVDLLSRTHLPWVKLLITVGSQAPLLYAIDALPNLRPDQQLPAHFPRWLNIYHRRDLLSYVGRNVFGAQVWDREVSSIDPFPNAHGSYWHIGQTWVHIAHALRDVGLAPA